jgi:hypothetical protein
MCLSTVTRRKDPLKSIPSGKGTRSSVIHSKHYQVGGRVNNIFGDATNFINFFDKTGQFLIENLIFKIVRLTD